MALNKHIIEKLEPEILDVIIALNECDFCSTLYSCSGHPRTAKVPYVDIRYKPRKEAVSFHEALIKGVPNLYFRLKPAKYEGRKFEEAVKGKDHFVHYIMDAETNEADIREFWDGWRKVLAKPSSQ